MPDARRLTPLKIFGSNYEISIFVPLVEIIYLHLKNIYPKILSKKPYNKPEVFRVILDNSISLVMMTAQTPPNPPPRGGGSKGTDSPFQSPFGDKPFG
jgi:hypothetical protein